MYWTLWEMLVNCNQILGRVADQNYVAIIDSYYLNEGSMKQFKIRVKSNDISVSSLDPPIKSLGHPILYVHV